jgi:hypothetical protein
METREKAVPVTAAQAARRRFEEYVEEKLERESDAAEWEFYTFLFEKARRHEVDTSGYQSFAYMDDREKALKALAMNRKKEAAV